MKTALMLTSAMTLMINLTTASAAISEATDLPSVSGQNLTQVRKTSAVMAAIANGAKIADGNHLIDSFNTLFGRADLEFNASTVNNTALMTELFSRNTDFRIGLEQLAVKNRASIDSAYIQLERQVQQDFGADAVKALDNMLGDPRVGPLYTVQRSIVAATIASTSQPGTTAGVSSSSQTGSVGQQAGEPVSA